MLQRRASAWTVLLSALALTSCAAAPPPVPHVVLKDRPPIPESLLTCDEAPAPPDALASDADLMRYAGAVWDAWADCYDKLADLLARQREGQR